MEWESTDMAFPSTCGWLSCITDQCMVMNLKGNLSTTISKWRKCQNDDISVSVDTVECRCNTVQFIAISSFLALQWQQQNLNQSSNSQQTPHTSPSRASYGESLVGICENIDRVITAPHRTVFGLKTLLWGGPWIIIPAASIPRITATWWVPGLLIRWNMMISICDV